MFRFPSDKDLGTVLIHRLEPSMLKSNTESICLYRRSSSPKSVLLRPPSQTMVSSTTQLAPPAYFVFLPVSSLLYYNTSTHHKLKIIMIKVTKKAAA